MEEVAAARQQHELVPQLRFPPGYRFVPTEAELVDVYLRAKIEGHKLPLDVVNDVDILNWQPGNLIEAYKGYGESRWFFFTVREQSSSNKPGEPSRKVKVPGVTAVWKATGSVVKIHRERPKHGDNKDQEVVVVGTKRVLIYNSSEAAEHGKWSMHEYILHGHDAIGEYGLYSIQRKQHSETEDKAGDGDDTGSEKTKKTKKRKRTTEPPHSETTTTLLADAEPPLKPARKACKAPRKNKKSSMQLQVGIDGEQQQQGQSKSLMEPAVTPPKKDELAPSSQQQGRQQQPSALPADGAPPPSAPPPVVVFPAGPLQAIPAVCPPSEPDGTLLGASVPMHKQGTFDEDDVAKLLAVIDNPQSYDTMGSNNQGQEQWTPSLSGTSPAFLAAPNVNFVGVGHADAPPLKQYRKEEDGYYYSWFGVQNDQHHLYLGDNQNVFMEQGMHYADQFLIDHSTTQLAMNSGGWEHGDNQRQIHHQQQQQENMNNGGGTFAVVEEQQQPMKHHLQQGQGGGHDLMVTLDEQSSPGSGGSGSGSDDLVNSGNNSLFGDSVQRVDAFLSGVLFRRPDEPPQDLAAVGMQVQGADDAEALQSHQRYELQWQFQRQMECALLEHVWDGSCSCMICAKGLWHYLIPGL